VTDTKPTPNRRSERSKQKILDATRELLAEEGGVRALTIEAVAARAGVGKTTIYRRWRDKWELALDAVMIDMLPRFANPIDVGDTRKELITFLDSVTKLWASPPDGPAMQGLVSEIATEPELARVYREQVVEPRREQLRPVIERGIARGDLRPDADVRLVHELLVGPILYRLLLSGPPLDRKLTTSLIDAILDGFRLHPEKERASARGARGAGERRRR
jgi:AcrR family transcriptional regulator